MPAPARSAPKDEAARAANKARTRAWRERVALGKTQFKPAFSPDVLAQLWMRDFIAKKAIDDPEAFTRRLEEMVEELAETGTIGPRDNVTEGDEACATEPPRGEK